MKKASEPKQTYADWAKVNRKPTGDALKGKIVAKYGTIGKLLEQDEVLSRQFVQDLIHGRKTDMSDRILRVYALLT